MTGDQCAKKQWRICGLPTGDKRAATLRVHIASLQIMSVFEVLLPLVPDLQLFAMVLLKGFV